MNNSFENRDKTWQERGRTNLHGAWSRSPLMFDGIVSGSTDIVDACYLWPCCYFPRSVSTSHCMQTIEFRPAIVADLRYRSPHRQGKEAMAGGERSRGTCCGGTRGAVAGREGEDYAMWVAEVVPYAVGIRDVWCACVVRGEEWLFLFVGGCSYLSILFLNSRYIQLFIIIIIEIINIYLFQ